MRPPAGRRARGVACVALLAGAALAAGCSGARGADAGATAPPPTPGRLFTKLPAAYTGVTFVNRLRETREFNVFTYRNAYNGGGVATGDLDGDGRPEIVLTANQGGVRLYRNEGAFRFRDVTDAAGLARDDDRRAWTTGVTLADVNGDGRLDVYVCRAGTDAATRRNALFVNQGPGPDGVVRFVDEAAARGVADGGYATHAAFLDHDRDGDLDLFVLRNSPRPVTSFGTRNTRTVRDSLGGARLYRNDGGRFVDVSVVAGIFSPENAFGLGLVTADVDRDGWPDLYVAHDYYERDYLYLNNRDGTFREAHEQAFAVGSYFSMGLDVADVDDDGWPDVYTTDMFPADERRLRTTTAFEGWDVYRAKVRMGYGHQLMRNMLHRNEGDGTFAEVGQQAGVSRSDWSWSALVADLDLDGRKDVFVTNGVVRDVTDQDYVAYLANQETMQAVTRSGRVDFETLLKAMPSAPVTNVAFRNEGGLRFVDRAAAWGLGDPGFSNGAAYADLDGDGALDLVVSNVDAEPSVYRNDARTVHPAHRWLQVALEGEGLNRFALGAKVTVVDGGAARYQELAPVRGFQSASDPVLTFGLGPARGDSAGVDSVGVDSVVVEWPDGRVSVARAVRAGQRLVLRQRDAGPAPAGSVPGRVALVDAARAATPRPLVAVAESTVAWRHRENDFVDFDRDRLVPRLVSTEGPAVAVADVDGDGLDDVYLGGAKDQPGALLRQRADGRFAVPDTAAFAAEAISEDVGATFADVNGDGRPDLYVVSGGNEFGAGAPALQDRLYLNLGGGRFRRAPDALPPETASGSRVVAADYDGDGDEDLFVGGRLTPFAYGVAPRSLLLRNDGRGRFVDVVDSLAPALARVGMVTDATWRDVDGDRRPDLVVVGDWMPITVFRNAGGGRLAPLDVPGLARTAGWWTRIVPVDLGDGAGPHFVVGNLGTNGRLRASPDAPVELWVGDFDRNGVVEQLLGYPSGGTVWPLPLRDDLLKAIPGWRARFPGYAAYADVTMDRLLPAAERSAARRLVTETFATALLRRGADGAYALVPLPDEAQRAPVFGVLADDVDGDGRTDLLLGGNLDGFRPELGRMAASRGLLLRGDATRCRAAATVCAPFTAVPARASGLRVDGQVRDVRALRTRAGRAWLVVRNDDVPVLVRPAPAAPSTTPRVARFAAADRAARRAP